MTIKSGNPFTIATIKSKLHPTSKANRKLGAYVEILPRITAVALLRPIRGLETLNAKRGHYKSLGKGSLFELILDETMLRDGGWFYLECAMTISNGARSTHLYFVDEEGRQTSLAICSNLRGTVREVVWIPVKTTKLLWSSTDGYGFFSQTPILISKISLLESYFRRVGRVGFDAWRFRKQFGIVKAVRLFARSIFMPDSGYQETIKIRLNRIIQRPYGEFLSKHEQSILAEKKILKAKSKQWSEKIHFLVVVRVGEESDSALLWRTLSSVFEQTYGEWALHLYCSDEQDFDFSLNNTFENYIKQGKIKLCKNYGVNESEALSVISAVKATERASHLMILRVGDSLHPQALYEFAHSVYIHPDAEIYYVDSDVIDKVGLRALPNLKPDWNQHYFFSYDYIGRSCIYSIPLLSDSGGISDKWPEAYGYAAQLSMLKKRPDTFQAIHIPKVLHHIYFSGKDIHTADWNQGSRIDTHEAGQEVLIDFFGNNSGYQVEKGYQDKLYRIHYPIPKNLPKVSIIIPTRDKVELLKMCIDGLLRLTRYKEYEVIIVDNGSVKSETHEYFSTLLQEYSHIHVLSLDVPFNYSLLNNEAAKIAQGDILVLLNNDIEIISEEWLDALVGLCCRKEVGAVGAKLLYPDGIVQHAGVIIGIGGVAGHGNKYIKRDAPGYGFRAVTTHGVSAVTAACLAVRKEVYNEVGGLDEVLQVAFNDVDLCLKIRAAGYQNVFTPDAELIHHESVSRGHDDTKRKQALFLQEFSYMKSKWGEELYNDPMYNPNLTLKFENFSWD